MKRAALVLPIALVLVAVAWPLARAVDGETGVCALMTPAKMLEHPALAHEYAMALRSGEPAEVERVAAILRDIRSAHGCEGEVALPVLPPVAAPRLPPGHPPVGRRAIGDPWVPSAPLFEAPGTVTI